MSRLPRWSRPVAAALAVATVGLLGATGAGAQQDPYGGTTTTPPGGAAQPTLELERDSDVAGARMDARACGYEAGTEGELTFNGTNVANTVGGDDGCLTNRGAEGGSALGAIELAAGETSLAAAIAEASATQEGGSTLSFRVPDVSPGTYLVCSVASGFETPCVEFKVIAERVRGDGAGGESGRQGLAFTGIEIAVLLALALVLLVFGRGLVQLARRRRRRLAAGQRQHRRSRSRQDASV